MLLDAWPEDALLQAIAAENLFAETAFLLPDTSGSADYDLRWFTPTVEVPMCGHATLAAGHVLLGRDPSLMRVRLRTRQVGVLEVARDGDGYLLSLPVVPTTPAPFDAALPHLGVRAAPIEVWRGDGYNLFLFASADDITGLAPDFRALADFGDVQFICTAPGTGHASGADVVSRVFVPGGGIDEDAATGSAHAALTPFWAARLGRDSFTAHQAHARGADFACQLAGDRVLLRGQCWTVVEGTFHLPRS